MNQLDSVVIFDKINVTNSQVRMTRKTRPVSWVNAALKEFRMFPEDAQSICLAALTIAEIALPYRRDAFRVIYALQLGDEIWVVHAFQKKSTQGIKTPKREIDLISDRLKRLKEMLR